MTVTTAARPTRSADAALAVALLLVAAVCWVVTAERMQGMDGGPGTDLGELGWFAVAKFGATNRMPLARKKR